MRKVAVGCLLMVAALFGGTSAAQASDQSIRDVVISHGQRQVNEDARFLKAMRKLDTKAQKRKAKKAAGRQAASVKMWRDALAAEQPETEPIAAGRKKMLNALDLYTTGLRRLTQGLNMAIRNGGSSGITKAKRALKNMKTASKRVGQAAEIIVG
jgi:hypothetical protein